MAANDEKLVNLADLKVAYDDLEAKIADRVAKSGGTMTGPLTMDNADIVQTNGYIKGSANDGINHAIKIGHVNDNVMEFNEYGGLFNFYRNAADPRELVFQINTRSGASAAPLSIGSGGTQASNTAGARTNLSVPYTSRGIFVNSFSEIPTEEGFYTVTYSGTDVNAPLQTSWPWWWNVIQIGMSTRLTQIAFCPYRERDCAFMRVKHDDTWYGWFKFQGTAV